jgi:hypothetical protein
MVVQVGVAFLLALEHANGLVISPEENIELDWCQQFSLPHPISQEYNVVISRNVTSLHDYHLLLIPDLQAIHSCLHLHEMGKNWGQGYCFQTLFSLWVVVFMQALLTG